MIPQLENICMAMVSIAYWGCHLTQNTSISHECRNMFVLHSFGHQKESKSPVFKQFINKSLQFF